MPKYGARHGAASVELAGSAVSSLLALKSHREDGWLLLRYLYEPDAPTPQQRLRILLRPGAENEHLHTGGAIRGGHLLSEFYNWSEVSQEEALGSLDPDTGFVFQVRRLEEIFFEPEQDLLYYAPVPIPADPSALGIGARLDSLLQSLATACAIDIACRPMELNEEEGRALLLQLRDLDRAASSFDPERRDSGSIESLHRQRDLLAVRHRDYYQQYFDALYSGRICEFGIRVLSADRDEGSLVASSLAEALTSAGRARVWEAGLAARDVRDAIAKCEHFVDSFELSTGTLSYSEHLAGTPVELQGTLPDQFRRAGRLSHLCCLADVSIAKRLLQLPTSSGGYLRTIRIESELERAPVNTLSPAGLVELGNEIERPGSLHLGLDQFQKHLFIAGVTGSGKTTTILGLLVKLWQNHRIPFLVLEPAKSEYRALAESGGDLASDLRIYTPGSDRLSPFRFNPLEVPPGVTVEEHISAIEACFAGAIPMSGGPLPSLLSEAIQSCYTSEGFRLGDMDAAGRSWPTMKSLVAAAREIMEQRGYVGEVKANLATALDVRLSSLCQRSVGRMFSSERSSPSLDELLEWPTILEMDALNLDQQNLLVLFLLASIRERLMRKGPAGTLRHVVVLEEAHNLIGVHGTQGPASADLADPRGHAARALSRYLAEIRAFGVGMLVVDQSPAAIAPDVLKNTSVKIVHRTVSTDDRDALAGAMLMDDHAHRELARLQVGEAYIYNERLYRPVRVACASPALGRGRPNDDALLQRWSRMDWYTCAQGERLGMLSEKLEGILTSLRNGMAAALRAINAGGPKAGAEWRARTLELARVARSKVEDVVADGKADPALREQATQLGAAYRLRMVKLLQVTSDAIANASRGEQSDGRATQVDP